MSENGWIEHRVPVVGMTLYCPDCGRWLARPHDDGGFDLASKASMQSMMRAVVYEDGTVEAPEEAVMMYAQCHRRRCLLKQRIREIRGKQPKRKEWSYEQQGV